MSRFAVAAGQRRLAGAFIVLALLAGLTSPARARVITLDVPYVPTPHWVVRRMLEMAAVGPDDRVVDLGSGDGRIVIAAVRDWHVASARGIDLDPQRVAEARVNARMAGVGDRVTFEEGDLFEKDFSDATVLTLYLFPEVNLRLRPVVLERLAPGTRVVSHAFHMGDWEPDQSETVGMSKIYLWVVPARVAGEWQLTTADGRTAHLALTQKYQRVEGRAEIDGEPVLLQDANVRGELLHFTLGDERYIGRIEGDAMVAVENPEAARNWHARRL